MVYVSSILGRNAVQMYISSYSPQHFLPRQSVGGFKVQFYMAATAQQRCSEKQGKRRHYPLAIKHSY